MLNLILHTLPHHSLFVRRPAVILQNYGTLNL